MEYAVIDLGSNTIRLCIYRKEGNDFVRLLNTKETVGLAGYRKNGELTQSGVNIASNALNMFKNTLSIINVKQLFVFSTASLRNVTNSVEVVAEIEKRTGFEIDLLSGKMEAELGFLGASKSNKLKTGLLIDIGGGSTELLEYVDGQEVDCISLPIGSLSLYSMFVNDIIPNKKEQKSMCEHVRNLLQDVEFIQNKRIDTILGIGGSLRTIKKMCARKYGVKGKFFDTAELYNLLEFIQEYKKASTNLILKVAPERLHTTIPGLIIAKEITKYISAKKIIVSNFGLREGYLYHQLGGEIYD
ncbi:phosphatase [Candidatus Epulonipiscium viviparus]|uniref:Ppx/GppA phosphatase family protein n=1 Tax=Candidatus Epulonipiscium viviparus TaxID=420336 RepID=UPI0027380D32|nr:phosphatase [Candidatus Epulopiscium viviparus]